MINCLVGARVGVFDDCFVGNCGMQVEFLRVLISY